MKPFTQFDSLLESMKTLSVKYDDLSQSDRDIYDKLKREHDERLSDYYARYRVISNLPDYFNRVRLAPSEMELIDKTCCQLIRDRVRHAFFEFDSMTSYYLSVFLFKSLVENQQLERNMYVEFGPDIYQGIMSGTLGLFCCDGVFDKRTEMDVTRFLWDRFNNEFCFTYIFSTPTGPRFRRYEQTINEVLPSFKISDSEIVKFDDEEC